MRIGILEPLDFSKEAIKKLKRVGQVSCYNNSPFDMFVKDKDVLFIRLGHYIDIKFLENARELRYLCSPTTGLNHIDMDSVQKRGVCVVSLKGEDKFLSQIRATPEHTFGLTLALLRRYKSAFLSSDRSEWNRDKYKGEELFGNTVGIIGFGRIGRIIAKCFHCFGAKVFFYDIDSSVSNSKFATRVNSIEKLIKASNVIVLAASYSEKNKQFLDKYYIDLLSDKYFINISRGELIDEEYLIKKIKKNSFKGVALDVINNENLSNNLSKIIELAEDRNLILTPHIGGATYESMRKTEEFIVSKLLGKLEK